MKIGVDIDGCLNNFQEAMAYLIKRDYGVVTPHDIYYQVETLNLNPEETRIFWDRYNSEILDIMDVTPGAVDVLKDLKSLGCHLNIITARSYNVAKLTKDWLLKHRVPFDNIFFAAEEKHAVCKWQNIPFAIEDNPDYALAMANAGIDVALYSRPYNADVKHDKIKPVNQWKEIYDKVFEEVYKRF